MAPHYLLLASNGVFFYFGGDNIIRDEDIIIISLEGKQSAKAEKLVDLLYEDNNYLYDIAHHFQDEQRYTVSLLSDILNKVSLDKLATMGFRENYLKSIQLLNRSIDELIASKDTTAMDIAIIILKKENKDVKRLEDERNKL